MSKVFEIEIKVNEKQAYNIWILYSEYSDGLHMKEITFNETETMNRKNKYSLLLKETMVLNKACSMKVAHLLHYNAIHER